MNLGQDQEKIEMWELVKGRQPRDSDSDVLLELVKERARLIREGRTNRQNVDEMRKDVTAILIKIDELKAVVMAMGQNVVDLHKEREERG